MSEQDTLGREAVSLLLTLLEADEPVIAGQAAEMMPHASGPLITQRLLIEAGYDDVFGVETDDGEELVSLFPIGDNGDLGYLDASAGFVVVPSERLIRRRVDIPAALRLLLADCDMPSASTPFALIDDILWEVGDARIGSRAERLPVWFVRRIAEPEVCARVAAELERRPHSRLRVILTSSRPGEWERQLPRGAHVASIHDVLRTPTSFIAHAEILDARLRGQSPMGQMPDIHLSPDGVRLTILGQHLFLFDGHHQREVVRTLVEAHSRGERVRTKDLSHLGSPARVFGAKHWPSLSQFLKSGPAGWGFEV